MGEAGRIGRFRVEGTLGEGGMGAVYEGVDETLRRRVAIKVLSSKRTGDRQAEHRFLREARAAAAVVHPHVAAIYEVGESDEGPYLAMEYVDGRNLRELLRAERPSLERTLSIARQILAALRAAHEAGVVHRDLKPANVMLTKTGEVKLVDFGLAKPVPVADGAIDVAAQASVTLTREGVIVGTPGYIAPEQVTGGMEIGPWTDIFSFGVVLHEMLTGQQVFQAEHATALMIATCVQEPMSVTALRPELPAAFDDLLERCLAKDPQDRFRDCRSVLEALDRVSEGGAAFASTVAARSQRIRPAVDAAPPRFRPGLFGVGAVAVLSVAAGTLAVLDSGGSHRATSEPTAPSPLRAERPQPRFASTEAPALPDAAPTVPLPSKAEVPADAPTIAKLPPPAAPRRAEPPPSCATEADLRAALRAVRWGSQQTLRIGATIDGTGHARDITPNVQGAELAQLERIRIAVSAPGCRPSRLTVTFRTVPR